MHTHYKKVNEPIYPRTAIQITAILNKLKSAGAISEKTIRIRFTSAAAKKDSFVMGSLKFTKRLIVGQ